MAANSEQGASGQGLGIASLVLGILAILLCWTLVFTIILGILAIIFGIMALKSPGRNVAIAGIVTGSIGLVICVFIFLVVLVGLPKLQANQSDNGRKMDVSALSSEVINYKTSNKGAMPDASNLSTSSLSRITSVTANGEPTTDMAVYKAGINCNGQSVSTQSFSISIKLSNGSNYCLDS